MHEFKSKFLQTLQNRGFIHQTSEPEALEDCFSSGIQTAYIGFDCTATSLHAGSLLPIMMLRWLQTCGHKPIVLMGGGTTRVGDPSGKDASRQLISAEQIETNKNGIKQVFERFLNFGDGPTDAIMIDNADWLLGINYIDFLRDVGRHFSVNRMLAFESVKMRLEREQPLTFLEFNYMILQAYDFVELNRRYNCVLQMGGSDQWGNIVSGIDLARRLENSEVHALTAPLLTTSSGAKMGKTADGAIWLNADMLSPYDYWQYWRNTEDGDVGRFLRLFTELSLEEISELEHLEGADINEAKKRLAFEATKLLHGEAAASEAQETARKTFEQGELTESLPTVNVSMSDFEAGLGVLNALVLAGLAKSNGEARRHIKGGAIKLNDDKLADEKLVLSAVNLTDSGVLKLSFGRKKHVLLKPC